VAKDDEIGSNPCRVGGLPLPWIGMGLDADQREISEPIKICSAQIWPLIHKSMNRTPISMVL
jgi:hypothetical protein